MNSGLIDGDAAGRIGISGRCGVAVPGGDGALFEVDAKGAGDTGIASERGVEPDRHGPSLVHHVVLADGRAQRKVHLIFRHAAKDVSLVYRPAHALRIRRILFRHQALPMTIAGRHENDKQEQAGAQAV